MGTWLSPRLRLGDATPRQFFLDAIVHYIVCERRLISCIAYFLTFLHKVCNRQISMTFRCWTMTLFSRSCHGPVDANVHCFGSFQLFIDIHDKSSYPWRFKCIDTTMHQVQLLSSDPRTGHMTSACMTSSQATKTWTSITPHRIEVEPWKRCHCVCLIKTHRLISNMTYVGHLSGQVIWLEIKSKF